MMHEVKKLEERAGSRSSSKNPREFIQDPCRDKEPYMREHGYWLGEHWKVSGAADHISYLVENFGNRTLPTFSTAHLP